MEKASESPIKSIGWDWKITGLERASLWVAIISVLMGLSSVLYSVNQTRASMLMGFQGHILSAYVGLEKRRQALDCYHATYEESKISKSYEEVLSSNMSTIAPYLKLQNLEKVTENTMAYVLSPLLDPTNSVYLFERHFVAGIDKERLDYYVNRCSLVIR